MTNLELVKYAKKLKIPNFRGVFMRDELASMKPQKNETEIINLDSTKGSGTHWVGYCKKIIVLFIAILSDSHHLLKLRNISKVIYLCTVTIGFKSLMQVTAVNFASFSL